ncbi:hypothetical protein KIH31_12545 [Paenarthrobacter sp. DKR-5]|uniref:hypothetical protein n=1 Tax=Paenarthrobacter sp. DKR-5 TaxID=2835535 RepID=UPI001BDCA71D|nr:hypothetical protein [Paenarthrobacter sp. DKR-5]MBT1003433.1 hypothetical protein [Paenarthrobacter sp. DKR-5]
MTPDQNRETDERILEMLHESDLEDDAALAASLRDLRALGQQEAPEPSAELAALLTPGVSSLERKRWSRRHRTAVVSVAVVGAMGLGAGAVAAANPDFRDSVSKTVSVLLRPSAEQSQPPAVKAPASHEPSAIPAVPGTGSQLPVPAPTATAESRGSAAAPGAAVERPKQLPAPASPTATPTEPGKSSSVPGRIPGGDQLPAIPLPPRPSLPVVLPQPVPGGK